MKKLLALLIFPAYLHAQSDTLKTYATVVDGDTLPMVYMQTVNVVGALSPQAAAQLKAYYILRRDVLRTYPYAKFAAQKVRELNTEASQLKNNRARKKFYKSKEDELAKLFEDDLRKLSVNQGRILMKLIERETGNTTYALVKEMRGGFKATLWQGMARLIGDNMRETYDAGGKDAAIEAIVQQIENGTLPIPAAYQNNKLK
ncbi:MAG: DUF4294 domain-containing protein [Bacteroidia bacterium]|nr:DUF4294 domain-containing protein [Bacteroidia bacterium]HQV00125.1 DUF4294 domain-containing protein [Bacteroidia bacterium]